MAFKDLREFIEALERQGLLQRITAEVDAELEITEITDRVVKSGGPALLFENVRGYDIPVLINAFGSEERVRLALGVESLDEVGRDLLRVIQPTDLPVTLLDKLKALPKLAELSSFLPKVVRSGSCKEVIIKDKPSLARFPILKCWPDDGGRFITLPLVCTCDPETGRRNVGMYRMQVFDDQTTGMHWHIHKDAAEHYRAAERKGQRLDVAVALGADPATIYAATAPMPKDLEEFLLAGFIRKQPVELVKCETIDVEVPAHAEIILEGYVDLGERRREGPFGDHTGYYSLADDYPVFHLTCVTHRKNPIYPTIVVGRPPMEDTYLGKVTERLFTPLIRMIIPEVRDMSFPLEGVFHNCAVVSIKKSYPGHARKVMSALWGMGQMMFTKMLIIVDEDVNVQDMSEVWWRVFNNIDARRDLVLSDGPLDVLDHSSPQPVFGAKIGIDATRKGPLDGHTREWPQDIVMDASIKALVDRKWSAYGLK